jgi:IstB-like ATP binding protein
MIAQNALAAGFTVRFSTRAAALADLLNQESVPAFERRVRRYTRPDVLILDELGYLPCDTRRPRSNDPRRIPRARGRRPARTGSTKPATRRSSHFARRPSPRRTAYWLDHSRTRRPRCRPAGPWRSTAPTTRPRSRNETSTSHTEDSRDGRQHHARAHSLERAALNALAKALDAAREIADGITTATGNKVTVTFRYADGNSTTPRLLELALPAAHPQ